MALETKLVQKLSQNLLMTPQLQQAIKLLQLGRLEYKEAIERELLENPILEEVKEQEDNSYSPPETAEAPTSFEGGDDTSGTYEEQPNGGEERLSDSKVDWEDYLETFTDSQGTASPRGLFDDEERRPLEATLTRSETLYDHLAEQVRLLELSETDKLIALHLLGNLDKDGYLCVTCEELAENCHCTPEEVSEVIELFKGLDPAGICAQSLSECLHFQLERLGKDGTLEDRIVLHHLDKLQKRKYDQIAKAEKTTIEEVYKAVTIIQTLEPHPGRPFADDSPRYITPDVYVYKVGDEYVISLNDDGLPRLRVSPYYLKVLQGEGAASGGKAYLQDRLKAASWLIKSIQQRQQTIYKVTESIMKFQREFLEFGVERMKPLVLKEVADDIGMHESTVSRVTTNKYVHTPQGVFELKYFFTSGIKSGAGDVSSSAVKERIRSLIAAESSDNPISDQKIVDILKQENVDIARRTVAKYREALNIPPSSQRKKPF